MIENGTPLEKIMSYQMIQTSVIEALTGFVAEVAHLVIAEITYTVLRNFMGKKGGFWWLIGID